MATRKNEECTNDEIIYEVERHFIGDVTPIQAILPVIMNDIKRKREKYLEEQKKNDSIDN